VAAESPAKPAIDAFNKGRAFEAVRLAKPLADEGNPEAMLIMALAYETGRGVDASREQAIDLYRKSREAGNQESSYRLARLLVDTGEDANQKEARNILEELAKSDTGAASRILGEGALRGWFGGEPDFEKTRSWWAKGAEQGDVTAMLALGRLLDGNFGFPDKRDPAAALEQFVKAASLDNPAAMVAAGSRLLNGDESIRNEKQGRDWLAKAIDKEQFDAYLALGDFEEIVKENMEAALANYRKGAENGQPACMIKLATFFLEGLGGAEKDPDEALGWFKKAGQSGNALGHVQAATILLKSDESSKLFEGYAHLIAAAEAGLADVQNEVGLLYLSGRLGIRDATAAAGWFSRASAGGLPQGANNLATLYEQGLGVPRSASQAGRLYTRAANAGHPQATTALGRLHAQGMGTEQNLPKAWALFSLAVERGDNDAKAPLGDLTSQLTDEQLTEGRKILAEIKKPTEEKDEKEGDEKSTPDIQPEGATEEKSDTSAE
jgi:TPR repeat protein